MLGFVSEFFVNSARAADWILLKISSAWRLCSSLRGRKGFRGGPAFLPKYSRPYLAVWVNFPELSRKLQRGRIVEYRALALS